MRKFRPFIYIPFITFFLLIACTEETETEKDFEPTPGTITLNESTVKPYQVVDVTVDANLNAATYQGSFGKENITLHKSTDTSLVFMVPAGSSSGIHPLTFKVDGKPYQTKVSVIEVQQIKDADSYVNDYLKVFLQDTEGLYAGIDKSDLEKAKADFDTLSEDEKAAAAEFIAANSAVLDQLQQEIQIYEGMNERRAGKCDILCHVAQFGKILAIGAGAASVGGTAGLAIALVGGIEVGLSLITGKRSILLMKIKEGVQGILNIAQLPQNQLGDATMDFIDRKFSNFRTTSAKPVFENNEAIAFSIKLSYRTLNQEDENNDESIIADFVKLYNQFRKKYPNIGFPSFNNKIEKVYADKLSDFSVKVLYTNRVEASELTGSPEEFFVKFSTQEKEDYDFTFAIVHDDGEHPAQQVVLRATMKKVEFNYAGTYLRTTYFDDGSVWQYDRLTFDSNGNKISGEYNIPVNNSKWNPQLDPWKLEYNGNLTLKNLTWNVASSYTVNSVDQTRFTSIQKLPDGSPKYILTRE